LASLTRLASCSWRSASTRCSSAKRARVVWPPTTSLSRPAPPASSNSVDSAIAAKCARPKPPAPASCCCNVSKPWRSASPSRRIAPGAPPAALSSFRWDSTAAACAWAAL